MTPAKDLTPNQVARLVGVFYLLFIMSLIAATVLYPPVFGDQEARVTTVHPRLRGEHEEDYTWTKMSGQRSIDRHNFYNN